MNDTIKALAWTTVFIVLAGGTYLALQARKLMGLCHSFAGFKLVGIEDSSHNIIGLANILSTRYIEMEVSIKLANPSDLAIECTGYNIDVLMGVGGAEPVKVSNVTSTKSFTLKPHDTSVITLPIEIDIKGTGKAVASNGFLTALAAKNYSNIVMNLTGDVSAKLGIKLSTSINITETLQDIQDSYNAPSVPCAA